MFLDMIFGMKMRFIDKARDWHLKRWISIKNGVVDDLKKKTKLSLGDSSEMEIVSPLMSNAKTFADKASESSWVEVKKLMIKTFCVCMLPFLVEYLLIDNIENMRSTYTQLYLFLCHASLIISTILSILYLVRNVNLIIIDPSTIYVKPTCVGHFSQTMLSISKSGIGIAIANATPHSAFEFFHRDLILDVEPNDCADTLLIKFAHEHGRTVLRPMEMYGIPSTTLAEKIASSFANPDLIANHKV